MVSKASDDLPEPERPVRTTNRSRGISTSMFLRLCSRAPRTVILSWRCGIWRDPYLVRDRGRGRRVSSYELLAASDELVAGRRVARRTNERNDVVYHG